MKRKAKAIICDMDGTAVIYPNGRFASSWDMLTELLSEEQKREWYALVQRYYPHGNYSEWFKAQLSLLTGKKISDAERILFPVPYSPGFREFFSNSNGLKKAILSAGIDLVARRIAEELHFDYWVSRVLEIREGVFTGHGTDAVGFDKSEHLSRISKILGVSLPETCYVGDTGGDITCLNLVGFPVAFNPNHGLEEYAKDKGIPSISDFRQLNDILEKIA